MLEEPSFKRPSLIDYFLFFETRWLHQMARNQEKAHTLMNKWVTAKHRMRLGQTAYYSSFSMTCSHRPLSAYECKTAQECLYWRNDILKELKKKLGQIQNRTDWLCVSHPCSWPPWKHHPWFERRGQPSDPFKGTLGASYSWTRRSDYGHGRSAWYGQRW